MNHSTVKWNHSSMMWDHSTLTWYHPSLTWIHSTLDISFDTNINDELINILRFFAVLLFIPYKSVIFIFTCFCLRFFVCYRTKIQQQTILSFKKWCQFPINYLSVLWLKACILAYIFELKAEYKNFLTPVSVWIVPEILKSITIFSIYAYSINFYTRSSC